jgi:hypothetical protein
MSCHICEIFTNALNGIQTKLEAVDKTNYTGAPAWVIPDKEVQTAYNRWQYNDILEDFEKHKRKCKRKHVGNGVHKGAYAFTLTKSPKDELTEQQMIEAVNKLMKQKSCPVKKFAWYQEKAGEEHVHIHGMYETFSEGRIEAKHFKRAWPIWNEKQKLGAGFRGGYHRPVRAEEAYSEYISKDGGLSETNVPT